MKFDQYYKNISIKMINGTLWFQMRVMTGKKMSRPENYLNIGLNIKGQHEYLLSA